MQLCIKAPVVGGNVPSASTRRRSDTPKTGDMIGA
jgi:hypothetical protein